MIVNSEDAVLLLLEEDIFVGGVVNFGFQNLDRANNEVDGLEKLVDGGLPEFFIDVREALEVGLVVRVEPDEGQEGLLLILEGRIAGFFLEEAREVASGGVDFILELGEAFFDFIEFVHGFICLLADYILEVVDFLDHDLGGLVVKDLFFRVFEEIEKFLKFFVASSFEDFHGLEELELERLLGELGEDEGTQADRVVEEDGLLPLGDDV